MAWSIRWSEPGNRQVAEEYLKYLYSPEGQAIVARNYYRPIDAKATPAELAEAG